MTVNRIYMKERLMNSPSSPPKRLYQDIGQRLRDRIVSGEFYIGDRFPPEREIAEQMGVSRTVIREALIMLELQGLVEVKKGSGVYVTNCPNEQEEQVYKSSSDDVGPFEMLQARQLLESSLVELTATQITKSDISRLHEALDMERQHLESNCLDYDGDELFHSIIAEASQNSVLADMVKELWVRRQQSSMWLQLHARISNQDYRQRWLIDHEKILAALQRRDSSAAKEAMWQHLENVKQTLLELSDVDDPKFDGFLFQSVPTNS